MFRRKAALFGANTPSPATLSGPYVWQVPGWPGSPPGQHTPAGPPGSQWDYLSGYSYPHVTLDAVYPGLTPTDESLQWLALTGLPYGDFGATGADADAIVTEILTISSAADINPGRFTLSSRATDVQVDNLQILYDGAPPPDVSTASADAAFSPDIDINWNSIFIALFVENTPQVTAYVQSAQLTGATLPLTDWTSVDQMYPTVLIRTFRILSEATVIGTGPRPRPVSVSVSERTSWPAHRGCWFR